MKRTYPLNSVTMSNVNINWNSLVNRLIPWPFGTCSCFMFFLRRPLTHIYFEGGFNFWVKGYNFVDEMKKHTHTWEPIVGGIIFEYFPFIILMLRGSCWGTGMLRREWLFIEIIRYTSSRVAIQDQPCFIEPCHAPFFGGRRRASFSSVGLCFCFVALIGE